MKTIHTDKAPAAVGPYSQAKVAGGFLFASGQVAINPATGSVVEGGIEAQTEQVCKNIEAVLRTHIQHCANARFIYAGSQRHMMGEIFTSPARPFYQSTAIMELHPIDIGTYTKFIRKHFLIANKDITEETVQNVYERFEGITWYIQFISNSLYAMTATGEICTADKVSIAIENI